MRRPLLSLFILIASANSLIATENYPIGARSAAVGHASVTYGDLWSAFNNQAGLTALKHITAGAAYENRFLIAELSLRSFAFALPANKTGVFALSASVFGGSLYNEKKAGLAFAKQLGEKFSAGIQLDYLSTHLANDDDGYEYGSRNTFTAEAGFLAEPMKDLKIGLHVFNPTRAKLADYDDERVPACLRLGGSYKFSDKVLLSAEIEKSNDSKSIFKTGLEYHIVEQVFLRAGIASNPALSSFGFGFKLKQWQLDMSSTYHQVLGFSPQVSLVYDFKSE